MAGPPSENGRHWRGPVGPTIVVAVAALAFAFAMLGRDLPPGAWSDAVFFSGGGAVDLVLFRYTVLPRVVVAVLAGGGLALAGTLMQAALRNALAEPATLGAASGAQLALTIAAVVAPALLPAARVGPAFAGAFAATAVVLALSWRGGLAPLRVVTAGLLVTLLCAAFSTAIVLFHEKVAQGLYLWGAGSLVQNGWGEASIVFPAVALAWAAALLLSRPLQLLALGDETARGLGVPAVPLRLGVLTLAVALAAVIVSAVGVIGFVGLAAPAIARLFGGSRIREQLVCAPLIGASLLLATDLALQPLAGYGLAIPAGAATALFGAPILLYLLPRVRMVALSGEASPRGAVRVQRSGLMIGSAMLLLVLATVGALVVGAGESGIGLTPWAELSSQLPWRLPRTVAALAAGAMMAGAGVILQRMSGNPLASPEILGISSGAALGAIVLVVAFPVADKWTLMFAAGGGAATVLVIMLRTSARLGFAPDALLLCGVAVGTIFTTLVAIVMAAGPPRLMTLLTFLTGSTYRVGFQDAIAVLAVASATLPLAFLLARWLEIHPLGDAVAQSLGVVVKRSRLTMILVASAMVAAATLVVGPLSFVGLVGPHAARLAGCRRAGEQLAGAAIFGALMMVVADWLGRTLAFPYQIPAGLVATLIGCPLTIWLFVTRR
ncbi:Fe(3+)-hydroxamate ABC transporter permease FhuB [Amorphus sp. 3PC139-8]|uniref:Fe(3+)-hydroxamate ABC transporter permease FhuB n=1 Tax=Amorphus sp. 3PC139-8 TaxID=2735676 RepID=UPI00345C837B